ncbi:hypothetical protein L345_17548, partial [Ophiophagus hannah]
MLNHGTFLKTPLKISAQALLPGISKSSDNSLNLVTQDQDSEIFYYICAYFTHMMYISSNFLLTAISID